MVNAHEHLEMVSAVVYRAESISCWMIKVLAAIPSYTKCIALCEYII